MLEKIPFPLHTDHSLSVSVQNLGHIPFGAQANAGSLRTIIFILRTPNVIYRVAMYATLASSIWRSVSHVSSSAHALRHLRTTPRQLNRVSMESIKELRKRTGAPIGAVKKALEEQSGDVEAAIDHLRKLGASLAAKKAHREASEGLISIAISPDKSRATIIEVNSETDFVARTPQFGELVRAISESTLQEEITGHSNPLTPLNTEEVLSLNDNKSMLLNAVSALGENIVLKRASHMCIDQGSGSIFEYTHGAIGMGNGRIGALVALKGCELDDAGQRLAMHIAAAAPRYVNIDSIPTEDLGRERSILTEAAQAEQKSGGKPKPPAVLQKIAEGRLKKWYSTVVLEEQEMLVETPSFSEKPRSVKEHLRRESGASDIISICRMVVGDK